MRTVLICHRGDDLNAVGLARWLASFSDLSGVVIIGEKPGRMWRRIRREVRRSGPARFLDVLAFRLYYRLTSASKDRSWEKQRLSELCQTYPTPTTLCTLHTSSPNTVEVIQ